MIRALTRCAVAILGIASLYGCAAGPDFRAPALPKVDRYVPEARAPEPIVAQGETQTFTSTASAHADWWQGFESAEIDEWVRRALDANPTVAAAEAALRSARELAIAQRGVPLPQVGVDLGATRQREASGVLSPSLQSGSSLYSLYNAQVSIGFVPDLFGGARRQVEASRAGVDQARAERDAAYLTLTANVVTAAVRLSGLRREAEATRRMVQIERDVLDIMRRRQQAGAIAESDVLSQEAALASLEQQLPALEQAADAARFGLAALLGQLPAQADDFRLALEGVHAPREIPLGVPAELVRRRPDVRAAEAALHVASAEVGVAAAALWPQLSIQGVIGSTASRTGDLFLAGTGFWSGGATLTQALFAGGQLVHRRRAAEAALDQAGAQYRAAVLQGFTDVANCLRALQSDARQLDAAQRATVAADSLLEISRHQLSVGAVSSLVLLEAERAALQAHVALTDATMARLTDTAALLAALGGRPPATPDGP